MSKFIRMRQFMQFLFDDQVTAAKVAEIGQAMLAARSPRTTDSAAKMAGSSDASYKRITAVCQEHRSTPGALAPVSRASRICDRGSHGG